MSWQAYIDSSLVASGHINMAAIISLAGDSVWAASPEFSLKPEEMQTIASIVEGKPGASDKAFSDGVYIAGERFVATKIEGRSMYCRSGRTGIAVAKTKQAIVVGHHGENQQAGNATLTVEALADYLEKAGY